MDVLKGNKYVHNGSTPLPLMEAHVSAQISASFVWDPSLPEEGGVSNYHRNLYRHQKPLHTNFHVDRFGSFRAYMDQTDRQTDRTAFLYV